MEENNIITEIVHSTDYEQLVDRMSNVWDETKAKAFQAVNTEHLDANVATSEDANVATSDANVATSGANVATSEPTVITPIKKRLSRDELQNLILSICYEWMSLEDLSTRINRDSKYLRNHVIPLLLASKKIQMLYPGTPNHPNQQYKVSD